MTKNPMFTTFSEMVDVMAANCPHALVLDWGQRLERALRYYAVAYHGKHHLRMIDAIALVEADSRVAPVVISALHDLRQKRNAAAHDSCATLGSDEAARFAHRALELIGRISSIVPDDLAISSGAARVA